MNREAIDERRRDKARLEAEVTPLVREYEQKYRMILESLYNHNVKNMGQPAETIGVELEFKDNV